ncbi:hypothetical protein HMPREF3223_00123 [Cutibacterium avidum]|nr:hypothetical protein HMPREF3223_00123 [Cutibacterium avidum]OIJ75348.1 hypothetical protein APY07_00125 [Cutibacterium avidum]OIJ75456.1 hypothetical protein APY08_00125 [Cutibacterium avidum]OIJ79878.1 hypothetical protein APY06_11250 [Cutibacterium avidum]PGX61445.1 hypothetical protein B6N40_08870 [Cutibacterium avidum]
MSRHAQHTNDRDDNTNPTPRSTASKNSIHPTQPTNRDHESPQPTPQNVKWPHVVDDGEHREHPDERAQKRVETIKGSVTKPRKNFVQHEMVS